MAKPSSVRKSARPASRKASKSGPGNVRCVLCAMDLTETSHHALAMAAELAEAYDAKLLVVHVVEVWDKRYDFLVKNLTKELAAEANEKVHAELAHLEKDAAIEVEALVCKGNPVDEVMKVVAERKPDLLVIGANGGRVDRDEPLGSVANRLLTISPVSVVVNRPCVAPDIKRVLCATDGSAVSRLALDWAIDLAKREHVESLEIVNAFQVPTGYIEAGMTFDQAREKMRKLHEDEVAKIQKQRQNEKIRLVPILEDGPAAEVICSVADVERADLVVIGYRARSQFARFLLGSVALKVVRQAHVSVLVVKDEEHKLTFLEALMKF
ncbi:MAG: universal stress protein [Planctomycetota bacterium]|nr:universal stress protein [Planctomycetota bacterium]